MAVLRRLMKGLQRWRSPHPKRPEVLHTPTTSMLRARVE